jgi:hypothetical protein
MKFRGMWLPLLLAALAVPGAVRAQEDESPRRRPGMIGVIFDTERREGEPGVRIIEVRRGSPADEAGVQAGDVVVRLNGRVAGEAFDELPGRLQAGDSVRMRIRGEDGGQEREVVVVAVPRQPQRFTVRTGPGQGERPMVWINGDSMEIPLQALTMRIDSLRTHMLDPDGELMEINVDSMVRIFSDSADVFIRRFPAMEFHVEGLESLEGLEGLEELDDLRVEVEGLHGALEGLESMEGMPPIVWNAVPGEDRPFFLELGRRAAAGAELAEMNDGLSRYFGNLENGALVIDVSPETPAARAGLEAGDVIVRAGGRDVNDPEDVRRALTRAQDGRVSLEVVRQGRRRELSMEWDGHERIIHREVAPTRTRTRVRMSEPAPPPPPPDDN